MRPHAGDRIVVESEKLATPSRAGVIEEVLEEDPARVRVRWEDGHTSIPDASRWRGQSQPHEDPRPGVAAATSPRKVRTACGGRGKP
jgi:hypothetical protein